MKFLSALLLIMLLSFFAGMYLPWWGIALAAFLVTCFIPLHIGESFVVGFLALVLLWGGMAYWMNAENENTLAHRIAAMLLETDSPLLLISGTAVVGGLIAGFASLSGNLLRRMLVPPPPPDREISL